MKYYNNTYPLCSVMKENKIPFWCHQNIRAEVDSLIIY